MVIAYDTDLMPCVLQSMGQYWPEENEECECGPFIIEAMSVDRQVPDITLRELKLTYQPTVCLCSESYHVLELQTE